MRVTVLGSGSSGNCTLVATAEACLLIDLGFGPRSLERRMRQAGIDNLRPEAILITHGHRDHCQGVGRFVDQNPVPVYTNPGTRAEVPQLVELDCWKPFETGRPFSIGDIDIEPFPIPHDAAEPVGFRLTDGKTSGVVATDLGRLGPEVINKLRECDWIVLESNHDEEMLRVGPYPWRLKQRVLGASGHLSNEAAARFLTHHFDGSSRHIFLAHLSRKNNHPDVALDSAKRALASRRFALLESCRLHLTHQSRPSIVLEL